jgi:hypothetical protein
LLQAGVPVRNVIERSIAFMILRSVRGLLSSFLLFFLLIPRSEAGLRRIWQVLIDLISRAHYKTLRAYLARSDYDVLHVFTPDTGAMLLIRAARKSAFRCSITRWGAPYYLRALDPHYKRLEKVLPLCSRSRRCRRSSRSNGRALSFPVVSFRAAADHCTIQNRSGCQ